ncbi:hypothetical protein RhiirA4_475247 [Rhizophagus irregularis]|uniref:HAT C-terminal dimerisation domain-containing protein n=1 Tax=Rhizophagus irregularis TaxID=588596 RepID=A0A2I1H9T8_9GLOM|nr:hypothetical protein RhiirA4_475247 [Rhizophagus irregularis]
MDLVLQKFNSPLTAFCPVFQQAYHATYKKLEDHVLQHPAHNYSRMVNLCQHKFKSSELNEFWDKVSLQLPLLEKIARNYIWLPISFCAVEKKFSAYIKF